MQTKLTASALVNKVVAKEELMATAKAMAAKIISKGSYAVSVAKAAINNGYDMDIKNAVEMEANLFGVVNDTHDKKEGMGAFLREESCRSDRFLNIVHQDLTFGSKNATIFYRKTAGYL